MGLIIPGKTSDERKEEMKASYELKLGETHKRLRNEQVTIAKAIKFFQDKFEKYKIELASIEIISSLKANKSPATPEGSSLKSPVITPAAEKKTAGRRSRKPSTKVQESMEQKVRTYARGRQSYSNEENADVSPPQQEIVDDEAREDEDDNDLVDALSAKVQITDPTARIQELERLCDQVQTELIKSESQSCKLDRDYRIILKDLERQYHQKCDKFEKEQKDIKEKAHAIFLKRIGVNLRSHVRTFLTAGNISGAWKAIDDRLSKAFQLPSMLQFMATRSALNRVSRNSFALLSHFSTCSTRL
jgi:hypothetical protein